ncbi:MAG: hypothetical protein U1E52_09305 [Geminicoccaceae bacterium]
MATRVRVAAAAAAAVKGEAGVLRPRAGMLARLSSSWGLPPLEVTVEEAILPHAGPRPAPSSLWPSALRRPRCAARPFRRARLPGCWIAGLAPDRDRRVRARRLHPGRRPRPEDALPPLTARLPFPEAWRVLLIFDRAGAGLHGSGEEGAFRRLPPYSQMLAGPPLPPRGHAAPAGLATADLGAVGLAIGEIQREIGDYFAPAQNGRFVSPAVAEVLRWLKIWGSPASARARGG